MLNPRKIRMVVGRTAGCLPCGYLIVRAQARREINIRLNNGRLENIATSSENGIGIQAFTEKGACGFASVNRISNAEAVYTAQKAMELAEENENTGCELNREIFGAPKIFSEIPNKAVYGFDSFTPEELAELAGGIHRQLREKGSEKSEISWQTNFRLIEDFWCIGRSDGTLVSFFIPRAVLSHQGTVKEGGQAQSFSVNSSGVDAGVLLDERSSGALLHKTIDKARFVQKVCTAPLLPVGSYPLLIDYGLAKGLAHEAFGHAVESDLMEESILGEVGKLKTGLVIARPDVDIIDGPLEGDWAYQPYSANGLFRETVHVVQNGVLKQGLGDIFSAAKAGMPVTGAGRSEYFGSVALPRMTNIRLVTATHIPIPTSDGLTEEISHLRRGLQNEGLLGEGFHILLLGYRGGQVNTRTGDFVFQCDGAVNLADLKLPVYRPGIFSGKILSVLDSVKLSLGEARYDAIGTCGKAGQMVPSSGGGSGYILLDKNENVKLGGNTVEQPA
ncbi:TldD/PmbA family protein [Dehalobacter sp. TBBPA1]|uniref:TldD/PmbA family protein n=1 Tax=Dehalobacter sp. TBBPA1 TaxID=3235037 RepID=UPI0034A2B7AE